MGHSPGRRRREDTGRGGVCRGLSACRRRITVSEAAALERDLAAEARSEAWRAGCLRRPRSLRDSRGPTRRSEPAGAFRP